jgi:hypothetical protein
MRFRKLGLRRRFLVLGLGVATPAALAMGLLLPSAAHAKIAPASSSVTDYVTFYGWVDNSPPGAGIAHPCIHNHAGGVGTYNNPVTFAEPNDLHGPWCQKIYVPFLKKYFIHEDQCHPPPRPASESQDDTDRTVNQLIAQDTTNNLLYTVTANMGVCRSGDFGSTWTPIGPSSFWGPGTFPRCIVINPANPAELWVGMWDTGNGKGGIYYTFEQQTHIHAPDGGGKDRRDTPSRRRV